MKPSSNYMYLCDLVFNPFLLSALAADLIITALSSIRKYENSNERNTFENFTVKYSISLKVDTI